MIASVKNIIKKIIPKAYLDGRRDLYEARRYFGASMKFLAVRPSYRLSEEDDFVRQLSVVLKKTDVSLDGNYIYPFDPHVVRILRDGQERLMSVTVDYATVLNSNLVDLRDSIVERDAFSLREKKLIGELLAFSHRIRDELLKNPSKRAQKLAQYFSKILEGKPDSFDAALQKILFFNAMFWNAKHWHNGLGRLDLILNEYYERDVRNGFLTRNLAKEKIKEFCLILGKDLKSKSVSLLGDTGQYILLGGVDRNGCNVENELTHIFLEVVPELSRPDPKLILRVNDAMSQTIWNESIDSILTGCGSPLLMNENVVMRGMKNFGYDAEDVWNVGTSACWEPLIIGKSFDQNNPLQSIVAVDSLNAVLKENIEYRSFDDLMLAYKKKLAKVLKESVRDIHFDCSPLYSLFFDDCMMRKKDFARGGAKYAYHGIQIVGLANAVNALLNIKSYVFDLHEYDLECCAKKIKENFENNEAFRAKMQNNPNQFGAVTEETLALTNEVMDFISTEVDALRINGNKVKVGFSSPKYITLGKKTDASLDGRKKGEPLAVHLSPITSEIDFAEICDFASSLNYTGNRLNGNVVDFIVPYSYAKNKEKFGYILKDAFNKGVYEMQLNVLDKKTLIDAKNHPEKYPNLIVRVWGFSAYFNDLPDEYKNNLINRASLYE